VIHARCVIQMLY